MIRRWIPRGRRRSLHPAAGRGGAASDGLVDQAVDGAVDEAVDRVVDGAVETMRDRIEDVAEDLIGDGSMLDVEVPAGVRRWWVDRTARVPPQTVDLVVALAAVARDLRLAARSSPPDPGGDPRDRDSRGLARLRDRRGRVDAVRSR